MRPFTNPVLQALIRKEWIVLRRDPFGLAVLFLMPALFILVMSLALQDVMDRRRTDIREVLWLDQDGSYFSVELLQRVSAQSPLQFRRVQNVADLDRLGRGYAVASVQIPPNLPVRLDPDAVGPLLTLAFDPVLDTPSRARLTAELQGNLLGLKAEYLAEDLLGLPQAEAEMMRKALRPEGVALDIRGLPHHADAPTTLPDATQQSVPAWIVFAMFFVIMPLSTSVIGERGTGTLQRLAMINATPSTLLLAKVPLYLGITLLQALVMLGIGMWLVPALGGAPLHLGSHAWALLPITLATGFAAIGVALLIAAIAGSAVQATTIGGAVNLLMAAVSGIMVPRAVMPESLQLIGAVSPMAWAVDGYWDIILRQSPPSASFPECAALLILGSVCMGLASRWLKMENG